MRFLKESFEKWYIFTTLENIILSIFDVMALENATLIEKKSLTQDVFELHYMLSWNKTMIAWQFITFIIPQIGWRAYSILEQTENTIILIIKRWSIEMWGRGWSIALCDALIGESFSYVGPAWHFILSQKNVARCFIGTGTGLVPLYSHILAWLKQNTWEKHQLVFGVRHISDLFYVEKFEALKERYPDTFFYHLVVSRDAAQWIIHKGYVTDFLTSDSIQHFWEFYLCGAPAMIEWCQEKLSELWVKEENIFFEKY